MMSLYVASHYQTRSTTCSSWRTRPRTGCSCCSRRWTRSPTRCPEILCVLQVALEGAISRGSASAALAKGDSPQGDLVPWTVATQFQDPDFPMLSGARIVRIATHPDLPSQGYGSRALRQQLHAYYEGKLVDLETGARRGRTRPRGGPRARATTTTTKPDGGLLGETIKPRARSRRCSRRSARSGQRSATGSPRRSMPTSAAAQRWTRAGYQPVYLRQTPSDATGEHSAVLIRALDSRLDEELEELDDDETHDANPEWLRAFSADFKQRFTSLLGGPFGIPRAWLWRFWRPGWTSTTSRARADATAPPCAARTATLSPRTTCGGWRSTHRAWWTTTWWRTLCRRWRARTSGGKSRRRCRMRKPPSCSRWACSTRRWTTPRAQLGLPTPQVMALFNKAVRKMHEALRAGKTREVEADMPKESALPNLNPHAVGLDEDLEDGYVSTRLAFFVSRIAFFGFSRHSRSLRSRLADAPGTTKNAPRRK